MDLTRRVTDPGVMRRRGRRKMEPLKRQIPVPVSEVNRVATSRRAVSRIRQDRKDQRLGRFITPIQMARAGPVTDPEVTGRQELGPMEPCKRRNLGRRWEVSMPANSPTVQRIKW